MSEPQTTPPVAEQPPPLMTSLAELAGKEAFSVREWREAREKGAPVEKPVAPEPPKTETAPAVRPDGEASSPSEAATTDREPAQEPTSDGAPPDVSAAAKTLAQHKSARAKEIQDEIRELTREKHTTRREIEQQRRELAELRAELTALKPAAKDTTPKPASVADPNDPEPKEEDFEHYRDYVKAQARWETRQELKAERQRTEEAAVIARTHSALERVYSKGAEVYTDFEDVLQTALDAGVRWSPLVTRLVFTHPQGHALAYVLAKDPARSQTLSAIRDPIRFGVEIAPLLAEATTAPKATGSVAAPPPRSQAQDPPKPVGTAPTASLPTLESAVAGTEISLKRLRQIRDAAGRR